MLFSGKENVFMCLIAFQKMFWKIFSGVWLCSWEYHRKHIFYLLLTFSRLPNKYIIAFIPQYRNTNKTQKKKNHQIRSNPVTFSHIFSVAKQIYNIIHSSIQKRKQNPGKKKNLQIRSNWEKKEEREATGFDKGQDRVAEAKARSRGAVLRSWSARRQDCNRRSASRDCDQCFARSRSAWRRDHDRRPIFLPLRVCESFFLSLSPFARLWAPLFVRLSSRSDLKVK